jgi:hypothetical protein
MMRHSSRERHDNSCGDPCRWKSLYEGSQTSLADMATKQASVIGDHDRMRSRLVMLLKRTWPAEFSDAERSLGHRMSDATDEVLLAYLEAWTIASATAVTATTPAGVTALRSALRDTGLAVPDHDDLTAWADTVRRLHIAARSDETAQEAAGPAAVPPVPGGLTARAGLSDLFDDEPIPTDDLSGLFDDEPPSPGEHALADLFDDEPATGLDDLFSDEAATGPAGVEPAGVEPEGGAAVEDLGDLFDDDHTPSMAQAIDRAVQTPRPAPEPSSTPVAGHGEGAPAPRDADVKAAAATGATMVKPELFPASKGASRKRTGGRRTRSRAASPDLDVPSSAGSSAVVGDDTRSALLAAVAIPRPVFVADLAAVAGSREAAEAWEAEMRRQGLSAPVRLIAGKPRHRLRGTLVLPAGELREAANAFNVGWWADAMGAYSGARMYEMAVLLHRVGDDVVSASFDEDVAKLRLKQARGLVGVVVATSSDLAAGEETRSKIADAVAELMAERLTLVAVLAIRAEDRAALVAALEEEAVARSWHPAVPVVVAQSWEWADDAGSSATLVLGG